MKTEDRYHKFVQWSEEDGAYVGYCPDLFPAGGVCHAATPVAAYANLCQIVVETVAETQTAGLELPLARTKPMLEPLLT